MPPAAPRRSAGFPRSVRWLNTGSEVSTELVLDYLGGSLSLGKSGALIARRHQRLPHDQTPCTDSRPLDLSLPVARNTWACTCSFLQA